MNKTLTALALASQVFVLCCCQKPDPQPEPQPEPEKVCELILANAADASIGFSTQPVSYTVNFNCTDMWTVSITFDGSQASWASIYPLSGLPGDGKFTITVNANSTLTERNATILLKYGEKTTEITLTQQALTHIPYTFTGSQLVKSFADTYEVFIKDDMMPNTITIGEDVLTRGCYYEAMCLLLQDIAAGGDVWKTKTYSLQNFSCPDHCSGTKYETYAPDEMDPATVLRINDKQYNYAKQHSLSFANYCTIDETRFSFYRSLVVSARLIHAFVKDGAFPARISSWQSDFLRNMEYNSDVIPDKSCDINDPVVVAARDAAIAGKTNTFDKIKAIFEYARDKWEWEDYYNTRKGAITTINSKGGNCCDLSHAIIAMARSAGIPARYVHGPETYYPSGSIWGHVWAELYTDGKWYVCDASNNDCTLDHPVWILEKSTINGKYRDLQF